MKDRGINITQAEIANETGVPVSSKRLAGALNALDPDNFRQWEGGPLLLLGATESEIFDTLNITGSWAAMLWETGAAIGHLVVVDGLDEAGYVLIRDPWEGTRYRMTRDVFLDYWTAEAIFARRQ